MDITENVIFYRNLLLLGFIVFEIYYTVTNPYPRTVKIWIFELIFFSIPIIWYFTLPNKPGDINVETNIDNNLNTVLSQTLAVIAAVGVLGTFFVNRDETRAHFTLLTEYLLVAFIFAVIAVLPVKLTGTKSEQLFYQVNFTILASACSFSFIGKALIVLIQEETR